MEQLRQMLEQGKKALRFASEMAMSAGLGILCAVPFTAIRIDQNLNHWKCFACYGAYLAGVGLLVAGFIRRAR